MKWKSSKWRFGLPALWFLLTISLTAWWMLHGLQQSSELANNLPSSEDLAKQHRMFFWEGSFLLLVIFIGGASIFKLVYTDIRRTNELRQFFSAFTHELKTSLTSLRLQAEIMGEDPKNTANTNLQRLLQDVVRLELQLENALILAQAEESKLFLESLSLPKVLQTLAPYWPQLQIKYEGNIRVQADQRALECILRNIFQNAFVHGGARHVWVETKPEGENIKIHLRDDGKGFPSPQNLGLSYTRHTTRSGAGIGLYLSRILAKRMGGELQFASAEPNGLAVQLRLRGGSS